MQRIISIVMLFMSFFVLVPIAHAQGTSIDVAPAIVRLDLAQDPSNATLTYTNNTDQTITLAFKAQNFAELEDGYKPSFFEGKDAENYKYGLASWIELGASTLVISPKQSAQIEVSIKGDELSPGAHYGTIIAQQVNGGDENPIQLNGAIAALIFVRTNTGKEVESASVERFSMNQSLWDFPKTFSFRLNNTGNTEAIPFGTISITNMTGKEVARAILNEDSLSTLPGTIRKYEVSPKSFGLIYPSLFHAHLRLHFGKSDQVIEQDLSFFSQGDIPVVWMTIGLVLVVSVMILVFLKRHRK